MRRAVRAAPAILLLLLGPPAVAADGTPTDDAIRLALQACRHPARYERCRYDCERQRRHIEKIERCSIDIDPGGRSSCPEHLVAIVRQCDTECRANYCPQHNP